jgi:pyruvate dehydrogenase E2 component (dihydrolipoamide acetyltransferase)
MAEIKLPELKENVDTVEVNAVKVSPGDAVEKDQPLLEVQADKAALDVPSPVAGRVAKVLVKIGDQIKVGQPYAVIEEGNGAPAKPAKKEEPKAEVAKTVESQKEPDKAPVERAVPEQPKESRPAPKPVAAEKPAPSGNDVAVVPAGPATRRLARELGIDLRQVGGTGKGGRVTEEDVKQFVRGLAAGGPAVAAGPGVQTPALPNFEEWGPVERQRLEPIRRSTAKQMALAWSLIPHVTQHDLADVTDLEAFRKQQDGKGPKLTVTAFVLKAVAIALKKFPQFNASLDLAGGQLVLKRYVHLGVAVDTDKGLLVPIIRDADKKSVNQMAQELTEISERARQKKIQLEEMRGGTFTITNLGGIGGTAFTPIVNWPEVAILGLSRSRWTPTVKDGQIVPRLLLPLSLSYDHRVIDGADAARFTRRVAEMLENPVVMVLDA